MISEQAYEISKGVGPSGYIQKQKVFRYNVLSIFIIHLYHSFGGITLKIELVVFVYELIIYLSIYEIIIFKSSVRRPVRAWFLRIASVRELHYVCVCPRGY